ncbi:sequence-specific DNA-binding high mobility group box protein mat-Mc, partial [Conidiobolus coronatus NRRL 28638]
MKTGKRSVSIKKKNHIPRPKNSFMIYRQEKQYEAAKHIEGSNNKDISKLVGKWWNNETEEVKAYYRKKAEEAKKVHSKLYPNYRYCPKKSVK